MPGVAISSLDPRSGARLTRYYCNIPPAVAASGPHIFGSIVTATYANANGKGLVRLQNPAGYGKVVRAGHYAGAAGGATGTISFNINVFRGANWATKNKHVPLARASAVVPDNQTIQAVTLLALAPDDGGNGDADGIITDSGGADEDTFNAVAAHPALADYHVGNQMQRLDTLERATLTAYTVGRVATHPAWTLGTADAPTGTLFRIRHFNRWVKDGDNFSFTCTAVGAGPQTLNTFFVDVLEAGLSGNNSQ